MLQVVGQCVDEGGLAGHRLVVAQQQNVVLTTAAAMWWARRRGGGSHDGRLVLGTRARRYLETKTKTDVERRSFVEMYATIR